MGRKTLSSRSRGQGLVEYAVILVLVTVVVVVVLVLLGPAVGNVFSNITTSLEATGGGTDEGDGDGGGEANVIVSVTATRTGGGHGNAVKVDIVVSSATPVTVLDSQSGASQEGVSCSGSCTVTLGGVGDEAGQVTVQAAAGGTAVASYAARD